MKNSKNGKEKKDTSFRKRFSLLITGLFFAVFFLTVGGLAAFIYQLLYKSDSFIIKEDRIDWLDEPLSREYYKKLLDTGVGQNIFDFDISSAADRILAGYPELKDIAIRREFPDRLTLKIMPRLPVAQVGESSFFLVDEEGVVLTDLRDSIREDLPIVTGVGWRLFRKVGQKEDSSRMAKALLLIRAVGESNFLNEHALTKIDVSDYRNVSFFIEDGIVVKIGHSNFKERLMQLNKTFASIAMDKDQIRYIDLRFDDVVVGTK